MPKNKVLTNIRIWFTILFSITQVIYPHAAAQVLYAEGVSDEIASDAAAAETIDPASLYSKACVLMDGDSGRLLFEKEGTLALSNASTTKILTCILVLEQAALSDIVTATENAAAQPKVHLGMKAGEQFYLEDLLYAMMLESYNDCAMALAEHVGGSAEGFAVLMNEKAREIGCEDSYFITPNGLDAATDEGSHHTTAADLARIMKYCCWDSPKSSEFLAVTQTMSYSFSDVSGRTYRVSNKNAFLTMMPEAISGKTGYTSKAGYCYVAAIESEGRRFVAALLACGWPNNRTYKWSDAKTLFSYGMEHYRKEEIDFPFTSSPVLVVHGKKEGAALFDWGKETRVFAVSDETGAGDAYLLCNHESLIYETILPDKIYHAVSSQDVVGKTQCFLDGSLIGEQNIRASESVELWDFCTFFQCFLDAYLLKNS